MMTTREQLTPAVASRLLGWVNLSDGRPDPKWQRQFDDVFEILGDWVDVRAWLLTELGALEESGSPAFKDPTQARAVIAFVFDQALPAYRRHHRDLLADLADADLFTPYFLARVFEAALSLGPPWEETDRLTAGFLKKINDYVGHRPVPMLESRTRVDIYPHEKVRPVPIYIRGAGAAHGRYRDLVDSALELLRQTDPDILQEACFDPDALDELAYDPRPYDHGHPVNRRPNYLFGEWDPHLIDNRGRYRRFVVRLTTLDAIMSRLPWRGDAGSVAERKFEAGAVLAGTILMAAGTSGTGPAMFDSNVTLSKLVPRIARYRDAFYKRLIANIDGAHGERLRIEAAQFRQPFASARQHLNQELARQRAIELQESMLALLFAEMGYPEASRRRAAQIPATSVRILSEIRLRLTSGQFSVEKGNLADAARLLAECEDLVHRGIECGALADPWSALGFQGLFPLFASREDSVRDPRLDDLIDVMGRIFHLSASLLAAAASDGEAELSQKVTRRVEKIARWWDQHATFEVGDLPRVHGGERAEAARHVARALAGVRSTVDADLAYWREQRDGFKSPAAFAQVVVALLRQNNTRAAMALLTAWLGEAGSIALEEGDASFHALSRRWMYHATSARSRPEEAVPLVTRFLQLLEANADEFWNVPEWTLAERTEAGESEDRFESAYEEVTFRDSADDGEDGALAGSAPVDSFPLEDEAERLEDRLAFLSTVAHLWIDAGEFLRPFVSSFPDLTETLAGWATTARSWQQPLVDLLDGLHNLRIPEPVGGFEDVMDFDRRRILREQLAESVIDTCLDVGRAVRLLNSLQPAEADPVSELSPTWEPQALRLEIELGRGEAAGVRRALASFLDAVRSQPLLFVPMSAGGHPREILRSRQAQAMIRALLERLPRLGLIRETYHVIKLARTMEQNLAPEGRKISEFDHLFPIALQSVLESLLDAAHSWGPGDITGDDGLVDLLRRVTDSFLALWLAHSQTLRLSVMESLSTGSEWEAVRSFVKTYGSDLFTPQFLSLANLRSVHHRGVNEWLESLRGQPEAPKLIDDLDDELYPRHKAVAHLEFIVQAMIENHEDYRDYNSTTTQSDYGENLHDLLELLKLKSTYERYAWRMRPLVQAHAVLCRRGQDDAALRWQVNMANFTEKLASQLLDDLEKLEQERGLRLRTIRDRLEERFVQPLVIDRLCAAVGPAMAEAIDPPATGGAFARLEEQLVVLTDKPIGVGLEPPTWLRRLEDEVDRVRRERIGGERPTPVGLAPGVTLTFAELQRQLDRWEQAI